MIENINEDVTERATQLAKHLLSKDLQRAIRISKTAGNVSSPSMDGMPKGSHFGNSSEDMMIMVSECKQLIRDVTEALNQLDNDEFVALQEHYLHDKSAVAISQKLCVSRRTVYNILNKGLSEFIYCYRSGELLIQAQHELTANQPVTAWSVTQLTHLAFPFLTSNPQHQVLSLVLFIVLYCHQKETINVNHEAKNIR